ncbi:hypothetical protein GCM10023149_35810 [Mucilaginibacter gynuensis]|uniref:Uncharacterized protein n=1 Tax=Mucilaginibacter gynuensis TaxID=1302236 RepID=A0ABP8GVM9_9SPHI
MKKSFLIIGAALSLLLHTQTSLAQFGSLGKSILDKGAEFAGKGGLNKILKQPAAITTNFKDVNMEGTKPPSFQEGQKPQALYLLPKAPTGGFYLCAGFYEMTNKSYCLHAGTHGPSSGDGYMLAPVLGPKQEVVVLILKSAEKHAEVNQHSIQILLWAIIARTRFVDFSTEIKATATILLTPQQLLMLEGGALGVLPANIMEQAKSKLPEPIQAVFEAENNIRRLAASGNASYEEMEKYAILAGIAPPNSVVPSGTWALHPDGYYIRYFPQGYSITRVQIYVPQELIDKLGNKPLIYDGPHGIACPASTGAQRLAQTNEPLNPDYTLKLVNKCTPPVM